MKKIIFLMGILLSINLFSCQDDNSKIVGDSLLKMIAKDADYIDFQKVVNERAYHVAVKTWNVNDVILLLNKYNVDSCEIPDSEFDAIKGGKVYREIDCQMITLLNKLDLKYKFSSFSDEQRERIRALYNESGGYKDNEELRNKIFNN